MSKLKGLVLHMRSGAGIFHCLRPIKYMVVISIYLLISLASVGCSSTSPRSYIDFNDIDSLAQPVIVSGTAADETPLRIAICPILSQKDTIASYRFMSNHLGKELGKSTILLQRQSYAEINVLLANGGADIAFLSSGAYASYSGNEDIVPLAMQERFGVPYYTSCIIVPQNSTYKSLEDLRGSTFAFTDPLSFSGHLAPVYILKQMGETPESFFRNYTYTYSHEKALKAVANRVVDGASVGSHVIDDARINNETLANSIRIIAESQQTGTGPVVARKSMDPEQIQRLQEIFLNMDKEPALKTALKGVMIDRFIKPDPKLYKYLTEIVYEMRTVQ